MCFELEKYRNPQSLLHSDFSVGSVLGKKICHLLGFHFVRRAYFVGSHDRRDGAMHLLKLSFLLRPMLCFHKALAETGKQ